jgi:hypothetical protein
VFLALILLFGQIPAVAAASVDAEEVVYVRHGITLVAA